MAHASEPQPCINNFTSLDPLLVTVRRGASNIIRLPCTVSALSVEIIPIGCTLGVSKAKQSQGFVWKEDIFI